MQRHLPPMISATHGFDGSCVARVNTGHDPGGHGRATPNPLSNAASPVEQQLSCHAYRTATGTCNKHEEQER